MVHHCHANFFVFDPVERGRIDADEVTRDREQVPVRVEDIAKVSKPFGIGVSRMSIMDPLSVTPVEEIA